MEFRLTLLGLLSAGPGHGYDLKRSWDHWFAASKPLAYGQVYATLARLVRDGLITQVETEPGSGPERKRYEVTDAGRQSVEQWLLTPVTLELMREQGYYDPDKIREQVVFTTKFD